jgi:dipeptidyl aminopeptidase/acylaminoacyl peptidase
MPLLEVSMSRPTLCIVILSLVLSPSAGAEEKRAFEIADYYRTAFVGSPVIGSDGTTVVFPVKRYELETGTSWSELWVMAADGSDLRQLTRGRHHDSSPTISPDSSSLAFLSNRDEHGTQIYLLPLDGGEAHRLTAFPGGVANPVWSPEGAYLAVTAEVYPECGSDADCNATIRESVAAGPLAAYMTDELLYRHWDSLREDRFSHVLLIDATTGTAVRDLTPGRWDSPTFSLGGDSGYAFSPDGSELCVVSNHDPNPASSTNSDLWLVEVGSENIPQPAVNITADNPGWDGDPVYSPDGRFIAFRSQARAGYEADLFRLAIFDRVKYRVRYLTDQSSFDHWVEGIQWDVDGDAVYFDAQVGGVTPVYKIGLKSGKVKRLFDDGAIAGWQLSPDGKTIMYNRSKVGRPPELLSISSAGGTGVVLTRFNRMLEEEVDIRNAEVIWVDGEDGDRIQVFMVKPHGFDPGKSYPLILNVHGGPQSPWKDRYRGDWQVYPGKGYIVAFPNPTGSAGFGQENVDAISCDYGGRVYDDLMRITDSLAELPYVDDERMGAMGWSWGGYMMMWFAGHTDRFQTLASMMGLYDLRSFYSATEEQWFPAADLCGLPWEEDEYEKWSPSKYTEGFGTPTLVITGERDYRVPYTQSLQFFTDLQLRKVPSRLVVFPEAGHWPSWYEMAFYYLVHLDWFHQWLGGGAPPWDVEQFLRNQAFVEPAAEDGRLGPHSIID